MTTSETDDKVAVKGWSSRTRATSITCGIPKGTTDLLGEGEPAAKSGSEAPARWSWRQGLPGGELDGTAFITDIEDRDNYIVRKASNLSKHAHILAQHASCAALHYRSLPETTTVFIDRFLATAEAYSVPVYLVFNKIDLYDEDDTEYLDALFTSTLYRLPLHPLVDGNGEGLDEIEQVTRGHGRCSPVIQGSANRPL